MGKAALAHQTGHMGASIVAKWVDFITELINWLQKNIKQPIFWTIVLLLAVVFFVLYDLPRNTRKTRKSIVGLFGYTFRVLMSFLNDILAAIESMTGFIDIVRIVLRGKITDGVQFLLGNYAIIALSVASFITTFNGMSQVMTWYAALLITFGIQVGILSLSSKLALYLSKTKKKTIKAFKDTVFQIRKEQIDEETLRKGAGFNRLTENQPDSLSWFANEQYRPSKGETGGKVIAKIVLYSFLLALSMTASIYFSYLYFFEERIEPNIPMNNYIMVSEAVSRISDDYTQKMDDVRSILLRELEEVNRQVRARIGIVENLQIDSVIEELQERIEKERGRLEDLQDKRAKRIGELEEAADESKKAELDQLYEDSDRAVGLQEDVIEKLNEELEKAREEKRTNRDYYENEDLEEALENLEIFYADPLKYINQERGGSAEDGLEQAMTGWRDRITAAFETAINYKWSHTDYTEEEEPIVDAGLEEGGYQRELAIFSNYVELCEYYQKKGEIGFPYLVVNEKLRKGITALTTDSLKHETGGKELAKKRKDMWNTRSRELVQMMLDELNQLPRMAEWDDMSYEEKRIFQGFSKTEIQQELYEWYRVSTGTVDVMEMAILISHFTWLNLLVLLLAVFIDGLAVILTLTKGLVQYENKLPRYRKLLYRIFIQNILTDEDKRKINLLRWSGGLGVTAGLLAYGYFYVSGGNKSEDIVKAVSLICFVMCGACLSRLIVGLYELAHRKEADWKKEKLYTELKTVWQGQDHMEPKEFCAKARKAAEEGKGLQLGMKETELLVNLLSGDDAEELEKVLNPKARLLLRQIKMTRISRRTMEYYYAYPGLSSWKDYFAGWYDDIDCAYIEYTIVKQYHMVLAFSTLVEAGLVWYVDAGRFRGLLSGNQETAAQIGSLRGDNSKMYILSDKFLRILYELIMEAGSGAEFDDNFNAADSLSDAYEEEDT